MTWTPSTTYPAPPKNVMVVSPLIPGALDVRWDDPALLGANSAWSVVGVNVYRSEGSDRGPYRRLNTFPVGGTFYRDYTRLVFIRDEVIPWDTGWQSRGDAPNRARWTLTTRFPLHKPQTQGVDANSPDDVWVTVNGRAARVVEVFGSTRAVTLDSSVVLRPGDDRYDGAPLPGGPQDAVSISYYTLKNLVSREVDRKSFYRVTAVATSAAVPGGLAETPLSMVAPVTDMVAEPLDYIWKEAIRRNRWILEQGGERVKLFVQRVNGVPCACSGHVDEYSRAFNKQPSNRCTVCYGVGWEGGYDGPYDIIVAPDDGEKRITQTLTGRRKEHTYEVFMSFSPVVSQRDFIVKQNNDRYSIGPVRRPSNRGNLLQQHFSLGYLDPPDIRYAVPIDGVATSPSLPWPATRYTYSPLRETYDAREDAAWPTEPDAVLPLATDRAERTPDTELRWRTGTGENINE
jgi:hypothetical protein